MPPQDEPMAPPAFPKLPPSALFSRLQSFLPVMEQENKKLEQALAAGDGAKHCIEADESGAAEDQEEQGEDGQAAEDKPRVIEMNFALGMMEGEDGDSSDDDSDDDDERVDLQASILSAASGANRVGGGDDDASLKLKLSRESAKPRPLIQELS